MGWIGDKHKLASDFMNYARRKQEELQERVRDLLTPGMGSMQEDAVKKVLLDEFNRLTKHD